jgi:hypothetical protein
VCKPTWRRHYRIYQCSGFGSVNLYRMFLSLLRIQYPGYRYRVIYFYGSGSGSDSFHQQAKNWRKSLVFTVLWLLHDFLSLKNDVNVPSWRNKHIKLKENNNFLLASWRSLASRIRIRIRIC